MGRLLFVVIVVAVVFWLLKSYRRQSPKDVTGEEMRGQAEDMVRCVHCGVHLPRRESILAGDKYYCSEAHRRIHADKPE